MYFGNLNMIFVTWRQWQLLFSGIYVRIIRLATHATHSKRLQMLLKWTNILKAIQTFPLADLTWSKVLFGH